VRKIFYASSERKSILDWERDLIEKKRAAFDAGTLKQVSVLVV